MIRALTGYSTRHPWKVITLWAVLGLALSALAPTLLARVTQNQTGDFLPRSYDSAAALHIAEEQFGVDPDATTVTVLVARADGKPSTPRTSSRSRPGRRSWPSAGWSCPGRTTSRSSWSPTAPRRPASPRR